MKKYFILFFIIVSCGVNKNEKDDKLYSCEEICNSILDENLYDRLSNGSYVTVLNFYKYRIYEVKYKKLRYFVSDSIKNIIQKSIAKHKCENITLREIKRGDTIMIKKMKIKKE